jgi:hypothetical protein
MILLGGEGKVRRSLGWSEAGRGADVFAAAVAVFCPDWAAGFALGSPAPPDGAMSVTS